MDIARYYSLVRPTVLKQRGLYRLRLWEPEDWEQEAYLCLFLLLEKHPELLGNDLQLRIYFKTKFSNYVKDCLRKQQSQKRQFDQLDYEEVGEVAHLIPGRGLLLDDYVLFKDSLSTALASLNPEEQERVEDLMVGGAFKGRTALIRKLQGLMSVD